MVKARYYLLASRDIVDVAILKLSIIILPFGSYVSNQSSREGVRQQWPQSQFSVMAGQVFLGRTSTKQGLMSIAQGHYTLTSMRLESATPRSRVTNSTTEPLRSQ